MKTTGFDQIANLFASRRPAMKAGGLGVAAAMATPLNKIAAENATPEATPVTESTSPTANNDDETPRPEFLFVQPFENSEWSPRSGEEGTYTLTVAGAAAQTIYFSD